MPENGAGIAEEAATGGIAFASRTDEVNARTTYEEVAMVIHASFAVFALAPKRKCIITVGDDIAVDDNGACR